MEARDERGPERFLPLLEVVLEVLVVVAEPERERARRAELGEPAVDELAHRVEVLVLRVAEAEDREAQRVGAAEAAVVRLVLEPARELVRVVGRLALAVRRHQEDRAPRARELLRLELLEVDDLGREAGRARLRLERRREALRRARLRAEVDAQRPRRRRRLRGRGRRRRARGRLLGRARGRLLRRFGARAREHVQRAPAAAAAIPSRTADDGVAASSAFFADATASVASSLSRARVRASRCLGRGGAARGRRCSRARRRGRRARRRRALRAP